MKVKECKKCEHFKRKRWAQYHVPANYHPIGFSHVYGWCKKHDKRCLDVKRCEE